MKSAKKLMTVAGRSFNFASFRSISCNDAAQIDDGKATGLPPGDWRRPTLWELTCAFVRYANLTFGGGSATTAVLHQELVSRRHWLDDERFAMSFALARLTPGTNVLACCAGVGWLIRRLPGALVALLAASVPSSLIVLILTVALGSVPSSPITQAAIQGSVASAVAITAKTGWTIAQPHFKADGRWRVIVIGGAAFGLHAVLGVPSIHILLLAAAAGALLPPKRG
jgi:chromate transporter